MSLNGCTLFWLRVTFSLSLSFFFFFLNFYLGTYGWDYCHVRSQSSCYSPVCLSLLFLYVLSPQGFAHTGVWSWLWLSSMQRSTTDTSDIFQRLKNVLSFWRWVMTSRVWQREKTQCYKVHRWSVFKVCSNNRLTSKCVCHPSAYLVSPRLSFFTCKMEVIMYTTQSSCEDCF